MGIFNNFPFTNFQEKNLDCIYKLAKEANTNAADALEHVNEALTNTESLIERTTALTEQAQQLTKAVEAGTLTTAEKIAMSDYSVLVLNSWPPLDDNGNARTFRCLISTSTIQGMEKIRNLCTSLGLNPALTYFVGTVYTTVSQSDEEQLRTARSTAIGHLEPISNTRADWDNARKYVIEMISGFTAGYPYNNPSPGTPAQLYYTGQVNIYNISSLIVNL